MLITTSYIKQRRSPMHSLKEIQMKCNRKFTINFDGGELSLLFTPNVINLSRWKKSYL